MNPSYTGRLTNYTQQAIGADRLMAAAIASIDKKLISDGMVKVAEGSDWSEWAAKADLSELELRVLSAHPELASDPYLQKLPSPRAGKTIPGMVTRNSDGSSSER